MVLSPFVDEASVVVPSNSQKICFFAFDATMMFVFVSHVVAQRCDSKRWSK